MTPLDYDYLQKMLKDKGITTVIPVGTVAHGGVLFTSVAAAQRGFTVVVPVDGMSGDGQSGFDEQIATHVLTHSIVYKVTPTTSSVLWIASLALAMTARMLP